MQTSLQQYQPNQFDEFISAYWSVCGSLNRIQKLKGLVTWTTRKQLDKQRRYYQQLLLNEEQRLWKYQHRYPFTSSIAEIAVALNMLLNPLPRRYVKGYAKSVTRNL